MDAELQRLYVGCVATPSVFIMRLTRRPGFSTYGLYKSSYLQNKSFLAP